MGIAKLCFMYLFPCSDVITLEPNTSAGDRGKAKYNLPTLIAGSRQIDALLI